MMHVIIMTLKINLIKIYSNLNIYDSIKIFMLASIHSFLIQYIFKKSFFIK